MQAVLDFSDRIYHVHAKGTKMLNDHRNRNGIYAFGNDVDKLAGFGDINWSAFFCALHEVGYHGAVSIEHGDRAWEGSQDRVKAGILLSNRLLEPYFVR